jgi:hypothetical protein
MSKEPNKSLRITVTVNPDLFPKLYEFLESQPSRLRSLRLCEMGTKGMNEQDQGNRADDDRSIGEPHGRGEKNEESGLGSAHMMLSGLSGSMN